MDENIKRAIVIAVVLVVFGKLASTVYDSFMGDTQDEMIANQQAFENHVKGDSNDQPAQVASMQQNCAPVLRSEACKHPRDMRHAESCIRRLRSTGCAMLPEVNLCHAVEELELCADPFLDPKKTRCDSMRAIANCDANPIPESWEERDELWTFEVHDSDWAAID